MINEMFNHEILPESVVCSLVKKAHEGDIEARNKIVTNNLKLVGSIARKYTALPYEDCFQYGVIGLMNAVEKFDFDKEVKFVTYATYWIRQSIQRNIENYSRLIRVPVHTYNKQSKVEKHISALRQEYDREPTITEISNSCNLSEEEVVELKKVGNLQPTSLDAKISDDNDHSLLNIIADGKDNPEESYLLEEERYEINKALDNILSEKEKDILLCRLGVYDDIVPLKTLGEKYSLTSERIRQLQKQAFNKFKTNFSNYYMN